MRPSLLRTILPLLLSCLLLCSCAGTGGGSLSPTGDADAEKTWGSYLAKASGRTPAPYLDSMSLRFGKEGDTRRVIALLWGNGGGALRLDVQAGVGATIAQVVQDASHFLIFAPMERRAYIHEGTNSPLFKIGVPLPFDLPGLEALLEGRHVELFGSTHGAVRQARGRELAYTYAVQTRLGGELSLDAEGRCARWAGAGWTIDLAYGDDGLVRRIDMASTKGDKGVVIIKERERPAPYGEDQLKVVLPQDVRILPLEDFARRR